MNKIATSQYIRITKQQARKLFNKDKKVYFLPCKMLPDNTLNCPGALDENTFGGFNSIVEECTELYCNNNTGYYLSYYIKRSV